MSDCPSTSLVKMPAARVAELARETLAWAKAKAGNELAPFEAKIATEIERRASVKHRWFRQSAKRQDVIRDLCRSDWGWSLDYSFAGQGYEKYKKVSHELLLATKESADGFVWVSTSDLQVIS